MPRCKFEETRAGLAAMVAAQGRSLTTRPAWPAGGAGGSGKLVAQSLAQVENCLGVDLAGTALGHT